MPSGAYRDYSVRIQEAVALLRLSLSASDPDLASSAAKGATVLAAAALERFLNDAITEACQKIAAESWDELSDGQKAYLARQIAGRVSMASKALVNGDIVLERRQKTFRRAVEECAAAFSCPKDWAHHPEFGLLANATTEPERIERILREFDPEERSVYELLDKFQVGRGPFLGALQQLIDARHGVAHALPGSTPPGPTDVRYWIAASFWLARSIDRFLRRTHGAKK